VMAATEQYNFSQRLVRKGALADETYQVLQHWDCGKPVRDNIDQIRETNPVGAPNEAWLREVTATISSRFSKAKIYIRCVPWLGDPTLLKDGDTACCGISAAPTVFFFTLFVNFYTSGSSKEYLLSQLRKSCRSS